MTVNEFCTRINLPAVVAHFGWEKPKKYRKLPHIGHLALMPDGEVAYNAIDLFYFNQPTLLKKDDYAFMGSCYRYFVHDHPELFDIPIKHTESSEQSIVSDYILHRGQEKFWLACRHAALEAPASFNGKSLMLPKLFAELGMPHFMQTEVGIVTGRLLRDPVFRVLNMPDWYANKLILPSFYAPGKLASLEIVLNPKDFSERKVIYRNPEPGWYGKLGGSIVGGLRDLFTVEGCTWSPKVVGWSDKMLTLHHSLQTQQCVEIWQNTEQVITNCHPLSLIKSKDVVKELQGTLNKLTYSQLRELETITKVPLRQAWLKEKTAEANISGTKFLRIDDRYYYVQGKNTFEFTNFAVELTEIKKEGDVYYQFGHVIKGGDIAPFKIRRKAFAGQYQLLKEMTDVMLDAGLGTPSVAPNFKNYLPNVIDSFNPENSQEKPKPAVKEQTVPDLD